MPIESGSEALEKKKIILEIGPGEIPIVAHDEGIGKEIREDENIFYIALEETEDIIQAAKEGGARKALYIRGDAIHSPIKSNFVDEIVLKNVLGDPNNPLADYIIPEIHRILKKKGILTIAETYTPDVALRFLKKFDTSNLFEEPEIMEDKKSISRYVEGDIYAYDSFICKLKKK